MTTCDCYVKQPKTMRRCVMCRGNTFKYSPPTVSNTVKRIMSLMRRAELQNMMQVQNWRRVHNVRSQSRNDFYTPEELGKILDICNLLYTKIVVLGFRAGLRREEIRDLEWKFINFKLNAMIVPQPKVHMRPKSIPLWPDLKEYLLKWQKKSTSKYVIGAGENGHSDWRPHENSMSHWFKRLAKKAGVNHGCLHV